jgi:hypothetical protein
VACACSVSGAGGRRWVSLVFVCLLLLLLVGLKRERAGGEARTGGLDRRRNGEGRGLVGRWENRTGELTQREAPWERCCMGSGEERGEGEAEGWSEVVDTVYHRV